jgi:hypothetical protein
MAGQEKSILYQGRTQQKDISLNADMNGLMPGMYLLQLRLDNNIIVKKFNVTRR